MSGSAPTRTPTAVLISGRGSNMMALVEAARSERYPARITTVISNRPEAGGLGRARGAGVEALAIDHTDYPTREAFERALDKALVARGIGFVACAGFMRILTPWFVRRWQGRMVNIHPSLLPLYPGLHTHRRALEAGDDAAGASVHWVSEGVDTGAVVEQARVPIRPGDTEQSLAERVLEAELELYPRALAVAVRDAAQRP